MIYQHLRGAPASRIHDGQRQEAKAVNLFAAATVLVGLAGISQPHSGSWRWLIVLLSACAAIAYATVVGATVFTLWPRAYRAADYDESLWLRFWDMTPTAIQHAVVEDITAGSKTNKVANAAREVGVYWVLGATAAEALFVAGVVILARAVLG
ncbi:MAG TPA: hypothetical protein VNN74_03285 [Candidatus Micrarchaeia archaeon]|nr:hypothetical protein [Candidatus Micrarchaeia archaeon]